MSAESKHLWGEDAEAVEAAFAALHGHHPERGGKERAQAAYAVVQAVKPLILARHEIVRSLDHLQEKLTAIDSDAPEDVVSQRKIDAWDAFVALREILLIPRRVDDTVVRAHRPTSVPKAGQVPAYDAGWNAREIGIGRDSVNALTPLSGRGWALLGWDTCNLILERAAGKEEGGLPDGVAVADSQPGDQDPLPASSDAEERYLATATLLNGGIAKCNECDEIMLEDERHWHVRKPSGL